MPVALLHRVKGCLQLNSLFFSCNEMQGAFSHQSRCSVISTLGSPILGWLCIVLMKQLHAILLGHTPIMSATGCSSPSDGFEGISSLAALDWPLSSCAVYLCIANGEGPIFNLASPCCGRDILYWLVRPSFNCCMLVICCFSWHLAVNTCLKHPVIVTERPARALASTCS